VSRDYELGRVSDFGGVNRMGLNFFVLSCNAAAKVQGSHTSWKVMEFKKGIFQAWKVMENDCGHGKSCSSHGIPPIWNFLIEG